MNSPTADQSTCKQKAVLQRIGRAQATLCAAAARDGTGSLVEWINHDLLVRWFVGLGIDDAVWDATTFTSIASRRSVLTRSPDFIGISGAAEKGRRFVVFFG